MIILTNLMKKKRREKKIKKVEEKLSIKVEDEIKPINAINLDLNVNKDIGNYNNIKKDKTPFLNKEKDNNINKNEDLKIPKENILKTKTFNQQESNIQKNWKKNNRNNINMI